VIETYSDIKVYEWGEVFQTWTDELIFERILLLGDSPSIHNTWKDMVIVCKDTNGFISITDAQLKERIYKLESGVPFVIRKNNTFKLVYNKSFVPPDPMFLLVRLRSKDDEE